MQSLSIGEYQYIAIGPGYIERGDIVMAYTELIDIQHEANLYCPSNFSPPFKRAMALPDDRVEIDRQGIITVNGQAVANSDRLIADSKGQQPLLLPESGTVPTNMLWLISDDMPRAYHCHYFDSVPLGTVYGIARPIWTFEQ
jgi:type IV secretory pathway protease TraF